VSEGGDDDDGVQFFKLLHLSTNYSRPNVLI